MNEFEFIKMPVEFARLFQVNMESIGVHFKSLPSKAINNKAFYSLAKITFPSESAEEFDFSVILKKNGWHGVRDQMTSQYLHFAKYGKYAKKLDQTLIHELVDLEEDFSNYSVQGFSRAYLLGFYFKLWQLQGESPVYANEAFSIIKDKKFQSLFEASANRLAQTDIMILLVLHFRDYLGEQKLRSLIASSKGFTALYNELDSSMKNLFMRNIARYLYSVGDEKMMISILPQR